MSEPEENSQPGPAARPRTLRAVGMEVLDGSAPWRCEDVLPAKPEGFIFGARLKSGKETIDRPCSSEQELAQLLYGVETELVFLPERERGVPPGALNWFSTVTRRDFRGGFLSALKSRGAVAVACIGLAIYLKDASLSQTLFLAGLLFGVFPVIDAFIQWVSFPRNMTPEESRAAAVHWDVFNRWVGGNIARWSLLVPIGIFVLVFLGQNFGAGSYREITQRGAIVPGLIRSGGEWWRLITGPLMHSADLALVLHIGLNSMMFWVLGKYLGGIARPWMVWAVFVPSALAGAVASVLFLPGQTHGSVGASGGILGMLGFLFWLVMAHKSAFPLPFRSFIIRITVMIVILGLLLAFVVDNAGHAGGFLCGLACGALYDLVRRGQWAASSPATAVAGGISLAVMLFGLAAAMDLFFYRGELFVSRLPKLSW